MRTGRPKQPLTLTEEERERKKIQPKDVEHWKRQMLVMHVFDSLVYNTDRNLGNILLDENGKIWMIDHTRAFRRQTDLRNPKMLVQCERHLWEKLRTLDEALVKARLKPFLHDYEIDPLLKRHRKLVEHFQGQIAQQGEAQVLFTLWEEKQKPQ